jgi:hypothetical protein
MIFMTYYGFHANNFWIWRLFRFVFVAPVFEVEHCAFEDVGRIYWKFIVENLIKVGPSCSKILRAELDLQTPVQRKTTEISARVGQGWPNTTTNGWNS